MLGTVEGWRGSGRLLGEEGTAMRKICRNPLGEGLSVSFHHILVPDNVGASEWASLHP